MKGVVLAAGKGTRLYPVTRHVPKPLLPLANRPAIAYSFDRLGEIGAGEVCVVVGENEGALREGLGDGTQFGVRLSYARQPEPKGLAHALSFARGFVGEDEFALILGDTVYTSSFSAHAKSFRASACENLSLVAYAEDARPFGVATLAGDRIVRLIEKPPLPDSHWVMAGVYFFRSRVWETLPDLVPSARGEYEITDAIMALIERGESVLAGRFEGGWFDTGTRESFLAASRHFTSGRALLHETASVEGEVGSDTVVGASAHVECREICDSTVLPGAEISVSGRISGSILGGRIRHEGDLIDNLLFG